MLTETQIDKAFAITLKLARVMTAIDALEENSPREELLFKRQAKLRDSLKPFFALAECQRRPQSIN